jgi:hypothetical protein
MWSDNETTVDYLNFGVVADACAKLVQQAHGTPLEPIPGAPNRCT